VSYRASTRAVARELELLGWVRNETDGGVIVWAQGPQVDVERLISWCEKGPQYASVKAVEATWVEEDAGLNGFEVRR